MISWCVLPCSRHSFVACSPLCSSWRVRPHGLSPSTFSCPLVSFLLNSYLGSHVGKTLWVFLLTALGSTTSQQIPWSSGSYTFYSHRHFLCGILDWHLLTIVFTSLVRRLETRDTNLSVAASDRVNSHHWEGCDPVTMRKRLKPALTWQLWPTCEIQIRRHNTHPSLVNPQLTWTMCILVICR